MIRPLRRFISAGMVGRGRHESHPLDPGHAAMLPAEPFGCSAEDHLHVSHQDVDIVESGQSFRCAGGGEEPGRILFRSRIPYLPRSLRRVRHEHATARSNFVWFSRSVSTLLGTTMGLVRVRERPAFRRGHPDDRADAQDTSPHLVSEVSSSPNSAWAFAGKMPRQQFIGRSRTLRRAVDAAADVGLAGASRTAHADTGRSG